MFTTDNFHNSLNFGAGNTNNIFYHSVKEHPEFRKQIKYGKAYHFFFPQRACSQASLKNSHIYRVLAGKPKLSPFLYIGKMLFLFTVFSL